MIQYFSLNRLGRDFVIGDIHGRMALLKQALRRVHFNPEADRLFAVGDLINKGDDSFEVVLLLEQPWFFAIRGNHEQNLLDCFEQPENTQALNRQCEKGGNWIHQHSELEQKKVYQLLKALPVALEVEAKNGFVGLVHGEVPMSLPSWQRFLQALSHSEEVQREAMWRSEFLKSIYHSKEGRILPDYHQIHRRVMGVNAVVHGHKAVHEPLVSGNQVWIDTYRHQQKFAILEVNQVIQMVSPLRR